MSFLRPTPTTAAPTATGGLRGLFRFNDRAADAAATELGNRILAPGIKTTTSLITRSPAVVPPVLQQTVTSFATRQAVAPQLRRNLAESTTTFITSPAARGTFGEVVQNASTTTFKTVAQQVTRQQKGKNLLALGNRESTKVIQQDWFGKFRQVLPGTTTTTTTTAPPRLVVSGPTVYGVSLGILMLMILAAVAYILYVRSKPYEGYTPVPSTENPEDYDMTPAQSPHALRRGHERPDTIIRN